MDIEIGRYQDGQIKTLGETIWVDLGGPPLILRRIHIYDGINGVVGYADGLEIKDKEVPWDVQQQQKAIDDLRAKQTRDHQIKNTGWLRLLPD